MIHLALAAVLVLGALGRASGRLVRDVDDGVTRWVSTALLLLAFSQGCTEVSIAFSPDDSSVAALGRWLSVAALLGAYGAVACLGRLASGGPGLVATEMGLAWTVGAVVLALSMVQHSASDRPWSAWLLGAMATGYSLRALCIGLVGLRRIASSAPRGTRPGLWGLAATLVGLAVVSAAGLVGARPGIGPSPGLLTIESGMLAVGLLLPSCTRVVARSRRHYRRARWRRWLAPLHRRVGDRTAKQPRCLFRSYVECRDGLTRLSPYLATAAEVRGLSVEALGPEGLAAILDEAVVLARHDDPDRRPSEPRPVLAHTGGEFGDDLEALLQMSTALSRRERRRWSIVPRGRRSALVVG